MISLRRPPTPMRSTSKFLMYVPTRRKHTPAWTSMFWMQRARTDFPTPIEWVHMSNLSRYARVGLCLFLQCILLSGLFFFVGWGLDGQIFTQFCSTLKNTSNYGSAFFFKPHKTAQIMNLNYEYKKIHYFVHMKTHS